MIVESGGVVRALFNLTLEARTSDGPDVVEVHWPHATVYAVADRDCGEIVVCSMGRLPAGSVLLTFANHADAVDACREHHVAYDQLADAKGMPRSRPGRFGVARLSLGSIAVDS